MVRDINFDITADDKTRRPTDTAAANFDKLQRRVDQTNTKKPSREVEEFAKLIDRSMRDGESAFTSIQRSIDDTKTHITKLRNEFRSTGSSSIFGDLKSAETDLKRLESVFKEFGAEGAQAGEQFSQQFSQQASRQLPELLANPEVLAAVGAAAVVLWGPVTAALTAALSAGVGLGVIGAAAAIQRNNPAIVAALKPLEADTLAVFKGASDVLVQPFVEALGSIDEFIKREGPEFGRLFGSAAGAVGPVVSGLEHLVGDVLPELTKLSAQFSAALADPDVKRALDAAENSIRTMFAEFGNHPQLIRDGFVILAGAIEFATNAVTGFIAIGAALEKVIHPLLTALQVAGDLAHGNLKQAFIDLTQHSDDAAQGIGSLTSALPPLDDGLDATAIGLGAAAVAGEALTEAVQAATKAVDDYISTQLGLDNANLAAKQGLSQLTSQWQKSKKPIDENTKAGQNNVALVLRQIANAQQVFDTTEKQTGSIDKATLAYDGQIDSLRKTLSQMGLNEGQIDKLIGKYGNIPSQVSTNVHVTGVAAVEAAAKGVIGALGKIKDKTVHVKVKVVESQADATLLGRVTGQRIAGSDIGANWMPAGGSDGHSTAPAVQVHSTVDSTLHNTIYLDGTLIDKRLARSRSFDDHRQRVGVLR